jgi:O-acetylhomoserine (thiol)-lyase
MGNYRFETLAIHHGQDREEGKQSRGVPVYRTSSYLFKNTQHAANLFALKELGNIYTRLMNPTTDVLEQRVAALEGGAAALALASGTAAIFYSIINLAKVGDEIIAFNNLYGGTYSQFVDILPHHGITVRLIDPNNWDQFEQAVNDKTRALFVETIGNPTLGVTDLEEAARRAHKHGFPLIVDNTFATPWLCRPIEFGADIVIHSLTKWIGGHGSAIGGIVVDAGNFDWSNPKFALYNEPDTGYHGLRFGHDLGGLQKLAYILRMRVVPLRNLGAAISPDNSWIFIQGLESVSLRIERHSQNALEIAKRLKKHPQVEWVIYPGLEGDQNKKLADKYLPRGAGGMVVFGIKGSAANGAKFIDSLQLLSHVANVGDAKSLAIHPSSTTHSQLSEQQQREAGLDPTLIRLSIGLEHVDDIWEDIDQALNKSR